MGWIVHVLEKGEPEAGEVAVENDAGIGPTRNSWEEAKSVNLLKHSQT